MRIATWNVEWFAGLFDEADTLLLDDAPSRRYRVSRRRQGTAIAEVLRALDADLVMVIEAPNTGRAQSTTRALERFAAHFDLRQSRAITGFPSDTQQEIAALYDPDALRLRHDPMQAPDAPAFDTSFPLDVDVDGQPDRHVFSKPPLELEITAPDLPAPLRMIGVHAKSKSPGDARSAEAMMRIAIANRRKQLAQCVWLRRRIDQVLAAGHPLIVLGDLNDGPGLDHYEKLFGKSSVEVVLGDPARAQTRLIDPHAEAWLNPRQGWTLSTARFYHRGFDRYVNALLDYVMLSPDLAAGPPPRWRIWHPFDDPAIFKSPDLGAALLAASDHFPVSVDLEPAAG